MTFVEICVLPKLFFEVSVFIGLVTFLVLNEDFQCVFHYNYNYTPPHPESQLNDSSNLSLTKPIPFNHDNTLLGVSSVWSGCLNKDTWIHWRAFIKWF